MGRLLNYLILISAFTLGAAPTAFSQEQTYPSQLLYTVVFQPDDIIRLISHSNQDTLMGRVHQRIDLNNDGNEELFIFLNGCGNWGHCIYAILTKKTSDTYRQLWSEYLYQYTVTTNEWVESNGEHWKNIVLSDRSDYGGRPPGFVVQSVLQYEDGKYRESSLVSYPIDTFSGSIHDDFNISHTTTISGKTIQLGRSIATGWQVVGTQATCYYYPANEDNTLYEPSDYPRAPITLRIINETGHVQDFSLDSYEDIDLYSIQKDNIGSSLIIQGRYAISMFDIVRQQLSPAIIPGHDIDYREDAISGSLAGLTFINNTPIVVGNAQGYGLFCLDFTNIGNPVELTRYNYGTENTGQPYLFVKENSEGLWSVILAKSNLKSASRNLRNQYAEIEEATFLFRDIPLTHPVETIDHFLVLRLANKTKADSLVIIDYRSGILHTGADAIDIEKNIKETEHKPEI